ncbi:MAG TPA: bifunctional metallophosphatase/5'-nucleotidase, partial [Nocardioides sp.]|nr:bifunctional metallophosphatase/5'-nucleotidase [Nocardioides sp.]
RNTRMPETGSLRDRITTSKAGGAAYLASLVKKERKKSRAAGATPLTVAAGDLIGASPLLSAAFHDEPTIEAMNLLGLDVSSVGNHEFDEGVDELLRMQKGGCLPDGNGANGQDSCPGGQKFKGADFPYLGANVFWKNRAGHSRPTPFKPYKIFKVGGQKVGFIGMTLEDTDTIVAQAGIADVDFRDEVETANALVPKLKKKGVKAIIVLLHEGVTPADAASYNACTGVSGAGLAIAENLSPKIDAVVSGHTHQPYNCVVKDPKGNPRLFTSASSFGRMVTKLHFLIDPKTHDIVRPAAFAENIINTSSATDKQSTRMNKLISMFKTLVTPIANAVIGHLNGVATISRSNDADGSKDSVMGNVIADAQKADPTVVRNGVKPVIAFMNPGGIRGDLVATGADNAVTYGAAFTVQPFNNFMTSMDLTGAQITAILNEGFNGSTNEGPAAAGPTQNNNNKVLQVSGLSYTWDASDAAAVNAPAVSNVLVDDDGDGVATVPIDPAATYRVVANNFLADGGDGFATFKQGTNRLIGGLDIDSLRLFLQAHDPYTVPTTLDRVTTQP